MLPDIDSRQAAPTYAPDLDSALQAIHKVFQEKPLTNFNAEDGSIDYSRIANSFMAFQGESRIIKQSVADFFVAHHPGILLKRHSSDSLQNTTLALHSPEFREATRTHLPTMVFELNARDLNPAGLFYMRMLQFNLAFIEFVYEEYGSKTILSTLVSAATNAETHTVQLPGTQQQCEILYAFANELYSQLSLQHDVISLSQTMLVISPLLSSITYQTTLVPEALRLYREAVLNLSYVRAEQLKIDLKTFGTIENTLLIKQDEIMLKLNAMHARVIALASTGHGKFAVRYYQQTCIMLTAAFAQSPMSSLHDCFARAKSEIEVSMWCATRYDSSEYTTLVKLQDYVNKTLAQPIDKKPLSAFLALDRFVPQTPTLCAELLNKLDELLEKWLTQQIQAENFHENAHKDVDSIFARFPALTALPAGAAVRNHCLTEIDKFKPTQTQPKL